MKLGLLVFSIVGLGLVGGLRAQEGPSADELLAKAKKAVAAGNWEESFQLLEDNFAAIAKHPEGMLILAESATMVGDTDKAMTFAIKAVQLNEKLPKAHELAAKAFLTRGDQARGEGSSADRVEGFYEEALSFAESLIALDAKVATGHGLKGEALYWLNNQPAAAAAFEAAAKADPKNTQWLSLAARSLQASGKVDEARAMLTKATEMGGAEGSAWRDRGRAELAAKDHSAAAQSFSKALTMKTSDDQVLRDSALGVWNALGATKQFDKGQAIMESWCEARPELPMAHWWRGYFLASQNKHPEALAAYKQAFAKSNESYPQAALEAGNTEWAAGRHEEAAKWFGTAQKLLEVDSADNRQAVNRFLVLLGPIFMGNEYEKGMSICEAYVKSGPENQAVFNNLAFAYREVASKKRSQDLYRKSKDYYEKASELVVVDPTATPRLRAQVLNDTGLIYHYHLDDLAKGIEYYRKALTHDPEYKDALENLAMCLAKLGKHEEAKGLFEKVLEIEPGRVVSLRGLAAAKKALGGG